jgi:serine/threonine protein kinase/Tfp pilus assembly protein PilF
MPPILRDGAPMNDQIVSHYRIHGKLGAGGMGVVYRAEDTRLGRMVALKFLPEESLQNPRALERFKREARTASALDHPNICTIYEIDEDQGHPFIAMQLLEGQTLRERIGHTAVPLATLLDWALQISDALQAAHARGVVHRDIKPANVFITERGQAKILDFGLAKLTGTDLSRSEQMTLSSTGPLTHTGAAIGTVAYMSPEQARGEEVDARTDLFSFGVLLYEMATGKQAFSGPTWAVTVHAILGQAPMSLNESMPGLPQRLQEIIDKCLIKNRDLRYQQAAEIHQDLLQLKKDFESGKKLKTTQTAARWTPKRKLQLSLAAVAVLLAVAATIWGPAALRRLTSSRTGGTISATSLPERKSIAVMPISATGDDPKLTAFGKGLLDDVAAKLSQLSADRNLEVIPARTLDDKKVATLGDAVKEFGVNLGLAVSLKQEDQLVRATYSLIDTKTDRNLAADSLTAPVSDLFTIEDKLTNSIANALQISLRTEEKQALAAHATTVPEAYQYFLEAQGYFRPQREALTSAETLFLQALKLDPNYGPAEAGLGETYWSLYDLTKEKSWIDLAQKACAKAIELGNSGSEGHACLGTIANGTGKYEKAAEQFQQAVQLDPTNDQAYWHLADAYQNLNQLDKAEELLKRRITTRPDDWRGYSQLGVFYFNQADYQKAQALFEKAVSLRPNNSLDYSNLGAALIYEAKYDDASRALEASIAIRPRYFAYQNLGVAYLRLRKFDQALKNTQEALKLDQSDYQVWGNLAEAYHYGGNKPAAQEQYKKAIAMAGERLKVNPRDSDVLSDLAAYWAMLGDRQRALGYLDRSLAGKNDKELLFQATVVYNQLHETGTALEWLNKALAAGYSKSVISQEPGLDDLHGNPRYQALMQQK